MSDTIYAKLTEDFIRRMRNWVKARDMAVTPSSWPGPHNIYGRCDGSAYMETPIPLLCGEAQDTEAAVRSLPGRYRDAVKQFWLYEGQSLRRHALRRGIDYHTFEAWVIKGHELLKQELGRLTAYNQARAAIARAAGAGA
jgi:hypothetical protein